MKDDAESMALPRMHRAHAVAQIDTIVTARSLLHGEDHRVALRQRHHLGARLHARPLFGEHEFTAGKIAPRRGKQKCNL